MRHLRNYDLRTWPCAQAKPKLCAELDCMRVAVLHGFCPSHVSYCSSSYETEEICAAHRAYAHLDDPNCGTIVFDSAIKYKCSKYECIEKVPLRGGWCGWHRACEQPGCTDPKWRRDSDNYLTPSDYCERHFRVHFGLCLADGCSERTMWRGEFCARHAPSSVDGSPTLWTRQQIDGWHDLVVAVVDAISKVLAEKK